MKILVLGIGNTLLADEGAGIVAMKALQSQYPDDDCIEFLDGGTLSFTLAAPIADCDALLVIDAAELHQWAGTIQSFENEEMDHFLGANRKSSVHEVGLLDLMSISKLSGHWPQLRALIGIQPAVIGWGETLSPPVSAAIPDVCATATALIKKFRTIS